MRVVRLIFKYSVRARRRRELIRIQISLTVPVETDIITRMFFSAIVSGKKKNHHKRVRVYHVRMHVDIHLSELHYICD